MSPDLLRTPDLENAPPPPDIFDRAVPPALQEAVHLTFGMIGGILAKEALPPYGVLLEVPKAPELDFSKKEKQGVTTAYFRLQRVRENNGDGNQPLTTLELGLVHDKKNPGQVSLKTIVRIKQTQVYDLGKNATEESTIVIEPPVHLVEKGEAIPIFDMTLINASEVAKEQFRAKVAEDIRESYNYIEADAKAIESRRKNRIQGTPLKSAVAA